MHSLSSGARLATYEVFAARLSFDETKHRIAVTPEVCGVTGSQAIGMVSVLVQKRRFLVVPVGSSPIYYTLVVPLAYLSSTAAAYIHTALFSHGELLQEMLHGIRSLCERSKVSCLARGRDGAASSEKLTAYLMKAVGNPRRPGGVWRFHLHLVNFVRRSQG